MSEMIERVAIALQDDFKSVIEETSGKPFAETGVSLPPMKIYERKARAAIEAMREPTQKMLRAADAVSLNEEEYHAGPYELGRAEWKAMINAALEEAP